MATTETSSKEAKARVPANHAKGRQWKTPKAFWITEFTDDHGKRRRVFTDRTQKCQEVSIPSVFAVFSCEMIDLIFHPCPSVKSVVKTASPIRVHSRDSRAKTIGTQKSRAKGAARIHQQQVFLRRGRPTPSGRNPGRRRSRACWRRRRRGAAMPTWCPQPAPTR